VETRRVLAIPVHWVAVALFAAATSSGCAAPTLYQWGRYEDAILDMYIDPGSVPIGDEILRFEADIEHTVASGRFVPPGVHAHLAYLYISEGDHATALVHLHSEKRKFPESARFIDGIIRRMRNETQ